MLDNICLLYGSEQTMLYGSEQTMEKHRLDPLWVGIALSTTVVIPSLFFH